MMKPNCLDLPFKSPGVVCPCLPPASLSVCPCDPGTLNTVPSGDSHSLSKNGHIQLCSLCMVQLQSSSGLRQCFFLTCLLIVQGYSGYCQLPPFPFSFLKEPCLSQQLAQVVPTQSLASGALSLSHSLAVTPGSGIVTDLKRCSLSVTGIAPGLLGRGQRS